MRYRIHQLVDRIIQKKIGKKWEKVSDGFLPLPYI